MYQIFNLKYKTIYEHAHSHSPVRHDSQISLLYPISGPLCDSSYQELSYWISIHTLRVKKFKAKWMASILRIRYSNSSLPQLFRL